MVYVFGMSHVPALLLLKFPDYCVTLASLIGGLLAGVTLFKPAQAVAMALIACVSGSLAHWVMKALKRDGA